MRRSKKISLQNKLRIFNKNVKTVLTYGAEAWRVTKNITNKTQAFLNRCLRYILGVRWPNTITNEDLQSLRGCEERLSWGAYFTEIMGPVTKVFQSVPEPAFSIVVGAIPLLKLV